MPDSALHGKPSVIVEMWRWMRKRSRGGGGRMEGGSRCVSGRRWVHERSGLVHKRVEVGV